MEATTERVTLINRLDSLTTTSKNIEEEIPGAEQLADTEERVRTHIEEGRVDAAVDELSGLRPPDRAAVLEDLDPEARGASLAAANDEMAAEAFAHIAPADAAEVVGHVGPERAAAILDRCPPDVAADVLRRLDWEETGPVLGRMTSRRAIGDLLLYQDDEAGGLMSPRVVALRNSWPAAHAINVLRYSGLGPDELRHLFAVDENNVLIGYLDLPELVFAQPGATVSDVMSADVISVETGTDQEEAARLMARYELRSVPVVDHVGRLKGAIAVEDLVLVASEEATEDMFRMVGVRMRGRETGRFMASVRGRLPWLTINLGTVLLAGWVLSLFQSTLDSLTILVVFLPVVMGQAGIAGTQTLTILVRSIALGELPTSEARGVLLMETALAVGQGLVVGAILVGIVWVWRGDSYLALVVAGALLLNMLVAALGGVLVPLVLRAVRIDPATSSAVFVTTLTDVSGIVLYLGLATAMLSVLKAA